MFAKVDDADFEWLNKFKWQAQKIKNKFYASTDIKCKKIGMHRMILGLTDRNILADHENSDGLDNQRHNLRPTNKSGNAANRVKKKKCTSIYLGVFISARYKYVYASCTKDGKNHVVRCNTKEENRPNTPMDTRMDIMSLRTMVIMGEFTIVF